MEKNDYLNTSTDVYGPASGYGDWLDVNIGDFWSHIKPSSYKKINRINKISKIFDLGIKKEVVIKSIGGVSNFNMYSTPQLYHPQYQENNLNY